jgi:hypothetical protein
LKGGGLALSNLIQPTISLEMPVRGNYNPYIEEEQTTQRPKEKVQKDKQRSTKQTYKTKDRETHLTVRYDRSL